MKQGTPLIRLKGADLPYLENLLLFWLRACLKKAFCKMCVTICGRFCPDEGAVVGYGNRIRVKYTAKWGVQIAGMIFQTRSTPDQSLLLPWTFKIIETSGGTL